MNGRNKTVATNWTWLPLPELQASAIFCEQADEMHRLKTMSTVFRAGISRLEVCIILAVIAIVAALILPAIQRAREAARRTECKNHFRQLGLGLLNYHDTMETFPYGCVGNPDLPSEKRWSWYPFIGNFWGHYGTPLLDLERAWDDPGLRPLKLRTWTNAPSKVKIFNTGLYPPPVVKCPNGTSQTHSDGQPYTDYVGIAGTGHNAPKLPRTAPRAGVWAYEDHTRIQDISDGTSCTLLLMETAKDNGCWLAGGPATVRPVLPDTEPGIGADGQFGGLHEGGANTVFADGSARFIQSDVDLDVLSALSTIAGSESVDEGVVRTSVIRGTDTNSEEQADD